MWMGGSTWSPRVSNGGMTKADPTLSSNSRTSGWFISQSNSMRTLKSWVVMAHMGDGRSSGAVRQHPFVDEAVDRGVQMVRGTCCGRSWVGDERSHCCVRTRGCGEVFDDVDLFDAHRIVGSASARG